MPALLNAVARDIGTELLVDQSLEAGACPAVFRQETMSMSQGRDPSHQRGAIGRDILTDVELDEPLHDRDDRH